MKRISLLLCLLLVGCKIPEYDYSSEIEVTKVGGYTEEITVTFPFHIRRITSRYEMDRLIEGLDSLLLDLKDARDQMPTIEPEIEENGYEEPTNVD